MKPLYYLDIRLLGLEQKTGVSAEVMRRNYDAMVDYMLLWNRTPYLRLPDFAMSEHGVIHFHDCKVIFDAVQMIFAITGILTIISAIVHRHSLRYGYLRAAAALALAFPAALGIFAWLDFNKLFITFHRILFRNDYWMFDPALDPVINILPEPFFLLCVTVILAILAAGALVLILKSMRRKRTLRDRIAHSRARGRRRDR